MIIITGAAGFIGSAMAGFFNRMSRTDLILVDDFSRADKQANFNTKQFTQKIERTVFINWLNTTDTSIEAIIHLGARTDTTEFDTSIFDELNLNYSKAIWTYCAAKQIPLIYASSAATYGLGELGFDDNHDIISDLKPLNPYGDSKNDFDKWALEQPSSPPHWYGLKFFNVYGPNEYHKGRMASVILHTFRQVSATGAMKLFRSHNPDYKNGEQLRDFIYIEDVLKVIHFLFAKQPTSGLYNLGTGKARTFLDLATATFHAFNKIPDISYIDTPADIRDKYQYFTEANMSKLQKAGYEAPFVELEDGVKEYVQQYLVEGKYY